MGKMKTGVITACAICGTDYYRSKNHIDRGISKTCGKEECKSALRSQSKIAPRPTRKIGATFNCVICGAEFYRKQSLIERGITNTCGKSECKSTFFSGSNNPAWGNIPSENTRKAVSESNKRRTGPPKGYKHTAEARAKISDALRNRWLSNRDKMIAAITKPPKPREEMRYRKDFTPYQRRTWKGSECIWCGSTENLVLDHIIPIVAGGANIQGNAQTLCQTCNLWKMVYVDRPYHLSMLATKAAS